MTARRSRAVDAPLLGWGEALRAGKARRRRFAARAVAGMVGGVALLATAAFPPAPRLVWNASASAPIGLYLVSPGAAARRGDTVVAWVPQAFRALAATRRYLPMNVPLVKRVAAVAGDEVCARGASISVNGRPVATRRFADGADRPMLAWSGCVRLRERQLLLLMGAPASFDGRYFGVTEGRDIIGKARLLWAKPAQGSNDE